MRDAVVSRSLSIEHQSLLVDRAAARRIGDGHYTL